MPYHVINSKMQQPIQPGLSSEAINSRCCRPSRLPSSSWSEPGRACHVFHSRTQIGFRLLRFFRQDRLRTFRCQNGFAAEASTIFGSCRDLGMNFDDLEQQIRALGGNICVRSTTDFSTTFLASTNQYFRSCSTHGRTIPSSLGSFQNETLSMMEL